MRKNIKWTKEQLAPLVERFTSWNQICIHLGLRGGSTPNRLRDKADEWGIDYSHFTGQGWMKGKESKNKCPAEDLLVESDGKVKAHRLRRALLEIGREEICEECGSDGTWRDTIVQIQIHHKNFVGFDNRADNLQFLCPNCHNAKHYTPVAEQVDAQD